MNLVSLLLIASFLGAAGTIAMAFWAVAERARAGRAELRVSLMEAQAAGAEVLKGQAAVLANAVADDLVKRATETFRAQDVLAQAKLEAQLKPVADTLAKFEAQVTAAEKARAEQSGGLKAQIDQLLLASVATQDEARKLSAALRRGAGVQGRWGEQMLRNVLEMAGLQAGIDFEEQVHVDAEGAAHRPDVIVRLPGGGLFVIDAKCSLTAFLEAQDAVDEAARQAAFARHAQSLRAHVQSLAARAYWDKLEMSPDFVAMFVPGDGFLAMALESLPALMTDGMERRVIVVTPTTLFALCKAVAYGWRTEKQGLNAAHIADLGRELYKRLSVMGDHIHAVGRSLETAVGRYNRFVGSLESQVLTQARRFEDLQVDHEGRELVELAPVE
ncbi:MAG: DNA recombination protein RmuC, partial [Pseudomonadota bacterium]|nr:DNA recombination protein RmuC [Pseudomonadota bacterium]